MRSVLDREVAIGVEVQARFAKLKAPDQIAELHNAWSIGMGSDRSLGAAGLAGQLGRHWSEFEQSEEFRAFDAVMQEGLAGCFEFPAQLDATAARGVFQRHTMDPRRTQRGGRCRPGM